LASKIKVTHWVRIINNNEPNENVIMKKICTGCETEKDLSEFRRDSARKDGRQSSCAVCARDRIKSAYTMKYKDKNKVRTAERRKKRVEFLAEYKKSISCIRCGENEPCCLDFHHKDPNEKEFTIAGGINKKPEVMLKELDKCVVLCANCHRKLHANVIKLENIMGM